MKRAMGQGGGKEKGIGRPAETKEDSTESKITNTVPKLHLHHLQLHSGSNDEKSSNRSQLKVLKELMECGDLKMGVEILKSRMLMGRKQKHSFRGCVDITDDLEHTAGQQHHRSITKHDHLLII